MGYEPILTNRALSDMKKHYISKSELLTAFASKNIESTRIPGVIQGIAHLGDKVIGVGYKKNLQGQYVVIYCWSRKRY